MKHSLKGATKYIVLGAISAVVLTSVLVRDAGATDPSQNINILEQRVDNLEQENETLKEAINDDRRMMRKLIDMIQRHEDMLGDVLGIGRTQT